MALSWRVRERVVTFAGRALVMGIVNVTPDSFSDGGKYAAADEAVGQALRLVDEGADILDIGGESTRPGSEAVAEEEELRRVVPVVRGLVGRVGVPISVDTSKAGVAEACLESGAHIVNDVTALASDELAEVVRRHGAGVVLMHMRGTPATMQVDPRYEDVTREVTGELQARLHAAGQRGIDAEQVVLDPGIGFGKTVDHNLELLARLEELAALGRPVCLGVSRKGFLGRVLGRAVGERLAGSLAAACEAVVRGTAQVVRVHDVAATRDAVTLLAAVGARRRH